MRTLKYLLQKEFRQIFRNKSILPMIFIAPVIQLLVLPLAADFEIKNINISIVDHDRSSYSQKLISNIRSSGYFKITDYSPTYDKAYTQLEADVSDLILEIPRGFEGNLIREGSQQLFLAVNAINGVKAGVGSSYLARIINEYNGEIRLEWLPESRFSPAPRIAVSTLNWFNPSLNYQSFMVPAILVLLVTMIGLYLCSMNIVKEKEVGTIEQINVTPIKKHYFILGKLIPFWVIGMFIFSVGLFLVARLVYGIESAGSIGVLYAYLSLYLTAVLGLGLLISTYSNTQQQAMSLSFFFMMIFILMGGLFTSIDSMPTWARWIAHASPVTYFVEVIRMVIMKGSGFNDLKIQFLATSIFAILFNSWAIMNYKKSS